MEGRELGGARGLGHVRHPVHGASRPASDTDVPGVPGSSPAQGLPAPPPPAARPGTRSDHVAVGATDANPLMATTPGSLTPRRFVAPDPTDDVMDIQIGPSHPASH